ncbi:ISAs1 family transposase, partial [Cutibacterium acnes]
VARVETRRTIDARPQPVIVRYFLLSKVVSPERMLAIARTHWGIENQLHWVLDVDLGEDAARSRKDNAPQNLALMRKLALNILRQHPDKGSIKGKIKRAGWDDAFLLSLLGHMR